MFYKAVELGFRDQSAHVSFKTMVHGLRTSMVVVRMQKGAVVPVRIHAHEQTGFLVSGKVILNIGGKEHVAEKGDAWCIPKNVEHHSTAIDERRMITVFTPPAEEYQ